MRSYIFIHPFGGDMNKLERGRSMVYGLRKAHPEVAIAYPLDMIYTCDKTFDHDVIDKWCAEWVRRSDGIIYPPDAHTSKGCTLEIEAAKAAGKEVYSLDEFTNHEPFEE